ncbi:MAG: tetratricopeptide repeat protein [Ferruginibacter sp.]|nr:tetratricopeptide repeat protein [Cytophagales bacterium]
MNRVLCALCGLLAGCCWGHAHAQKQGKIDSLRRALTQPIPDTLKVIALGELAWEYHIHNKAKALHYAGEELALAKKLSFAKGIGLGYMDQGMTYSYHRNYPEAIDRYRRALPFFQKARKLHLIAFVHYNTGVAYGKFEDSHKAIEHFLKAVDAFAKQEDWANVSQSYTGIANSYATLRLYVKAIDFHRKALRVAEAQKNDETTAVAMSDFAATYNSLFDAYHQMAHLDSSIALLNRVRVLLRTGTVENPIMLPAVMHNLGNAYFQQRKYPLAVDYLRQALDLAGPVHLQSVVCQGNTILGKIHTRQGNYALAEQRLRQALPIARQTSPQLLADTYQALFEWAVAKGDYRRAIDYQSQFVVLKDSLYDIQKAEVAQHLGLRYETAEKTAKIDALQRENTLQRKWNYLSIVLAATGLFLSMVLFWAWRLKKRVLIQKERLLREGGEKALLKQELMERRHAQLQEELQLQTTMTQLKEEQLRQEIDFKQRELTIQVLLLEQHNEFLQNLKGHLKEMLPKATGLKAELTKLFRLLDNRMNDDKEFEKFTVHFENVHPDFFHRLRAASPANLGQSELKFCAYVRMALSTKEIAHLLNVEPKSIQMARYRLKQKFRLPEETDLVQFIQQL